MSNTIFDKTLPLGHASVVRETPEDLPFHFFSLSYQTTSVPKQRRMARTKQTARIAAPVPPTDAAQRRALHEARIPVVADDVPERTRRRGGRGRRRTRGRARAVWR